MRKIIYNDPINARNESPLASFFSKRLSNQFSDARENPSSHAYIVGTPTGIVGVPGKKNWIYIQRVVSGDDNVVLQCYVPGNGSGATATNWQAGMAITPKRSADTNPTYYYYTGLPPTPRGDVKPLCNISSGSDPTIKDRYQTSTGVVLTDCIQSEFSQDPTTGAYNYLGSTYNGTPVSVPQLQPLNGTGAPATLPNLNNLQGFVANPGDLAAARNSNVTDYSRTPYQGPLPPTSFSTGTLWDDGTYLRRYLKPAVALGVGRLNWQIIRGPRTGIFLDCFAVEYINRGQAVYLVAHDDDGGVIRPLRVATSFTDQAQGLVLGIADTSAAKGALVTIQTAGMWSAPLEYPGFTPGADLYLDGTGRLTDTIPPTGSGLILQPMGSAVDARSANIRVGTAIKRAGLGGLNFVSPFGSSYPTLDSVSGKKLWLSVDSFLNLRFNDPIPYWPDRSGSSVVFTPQFSILQDTRFHYRQSVFPGGKPGVSIGFGQSMETVTPVTGIKAIFVLFNFDYTFYNFSGIMRLFGSLGDVDNWFGERGPYIFYQAPDANPKLRAATIKMNGAVTPYEGVLRPVSTMLMSIYYATGTSSSIDAFGIKDDWSWQGAIGEFLALDHVPDHTEETYIMNSLAAKWGLDYSTALHAAASVTATGLKVPPGEVHVSLISHATMTARPS